MATWSDNIRVYRDMVYQLPKRKGRFINDVLIVFGSSGMARGMMFVAGLLVARMLTPKNYGIFALGLAVAQAGPEILDWGLTQTMIRFGSPERDDRSVFSGILLYVLANRAWTALVAMSLGTIFAIFFAHWTDKPELFLPFLIGALGAAVGLFQYYTVSYFQMQERFRSFAAVDIGISAGVLITVTVLWGLGIKSYTFLLLAFVLIPGAGFFTIVPDLVRRFREPRVPPQVFLKQVRRFSFWLTASTISCVGVRRADMFLLVCFVPLDKVGLYAAAFLLTKPLEMVSQSVARVLFPRVACMKSPAQFQHFVRYALLFSVLGLGAVAFLMIIIAPWLLGFIGPKYAGSVGSFRLLLLVPVFSSASNLLSYIFLTKNAPQVPARINLVSAAFNILLIVLLVPALGIEGAASAVVLTAVAQTIVHGWCVLPHTRQPVGAAVNG